MTTIMCKWYEADSFLPGEITPWKINVALGSADGLAQTMSFPLGWSVMDHCPNIQNAFLLANPPKIIHIKILSQLLHITPFYFDIRLNFTKDYVVAFYFLHHFTLHAAIEHILHHLLHFSHLFLHFLYQICTFYENLRGRPLLSVIKMVYVKHNLLGSAVLTAPLRCIMSILWKGMG